MIKYNFNSLHITVRAEQFDISKVEAQRMLKKECIEAAIFELTDENLKEILLVMLENIEVK